MNKKLLEQISNEFSTPTYIFDLDAFKERGTRVKKAFGKQVHLCYSVKANPFLLRNLPSVYEYIEICSPGELTIFEKEKLDFSRVIFSGVNKTYEDVERAMRDDVGIFTAESKRHIEYINTCAVKNQKKVKVILRLSHGSQFGMDETDITEIIRSREELDGCNIIGLHYFTGTQKKKSKIIKQELDFIDDFAQMLKKNYGFETKHVEYGTGLAVDYFSDETEQTDMSLLEEVAPFIREFAAKYSLCVEMGRFFAAECGTYLSKVVDTKCVHDVNYAICDGGIHQIKYFGQTMAMQVPFMTVLNAKQREKSFWTICGSLCTTADILVRKAELPTLIPGDVIAFHRVGAYSVMEGISVFLSREMPRVILYTESGGSKMVRDFIHTDLFNMPSEADS